MIRLSQLMAGYLGTPVLKDITIVIPTGQCAVVTGPSGSGKSTLLRALAGLERPVSGEIALDGTTVSAGGAELVPPHARGIAFVFQDLGLWGHLTVFQNVILGLGGHSLAAGERKDRTWSILRNYRIEHLAGRRPGRISVGEQQRVALARALVGRPGILLLDEPFSALDIPLRESLYELIRLPNGAPVTCLMVTHDPLDAAGIGADRLIVLESGRIADDIRVNELGRTVTGSVTLQAWARRLAEWNARLKVD